MPADTSDPRSGRWHRAVGSIILCYVLAILAIAPFAAEPGLVMPATTPFVMAGVMATDLSTSFLLYVWFRDVRTWSLLLLASAYLFSGLMAIVHLTTFPDGILPGQAILGSRQSAALTFLLWTDGYSALALAAVVAEARVDAGWLVGAPVRRAISASAGLTVFGVGGCAVAATVMIDWMPPLMAGASFTPTNQVMVWSALVLMILAIVIVLTRISDRNPLFLWLAVALMALLCSNVLSLIGGGRYTIGWLLSRLIWLLSAGTLFLFFMGRFARQQGLLLQARDTLERRVEQRTADLQSTVRQRDLLLREVYHRVKNNLQVVDSLIAIERRRLSDAAARDALAELRNRIHTLGLGHQQLMSSENLETFSIAPFLHELVDSVTSSFGKKAKDLKVFVASDPVPVGLDFAIPLGLLTTELLSDVIKYADATIVRIEFFRYGDHNATLVVDDNGNNIPSGSGMPTIRADTGRKIIDGMTRQLEGQMRVFHRDGVRVEISMPLPEAA